MAMNKVQFERALSMAEFVEQFGTEEECETALTGHHGRLSRHA